MAENNDFFGGWIQELGVLWVKLHSVPERGEREFKSNS